jgi:dTDP-4-amino-4,6-dideoxygalactose transaminase
MAKLVAAVEGGCVLTNDDEIAEKIRMIRNHGMQGRYDYGMFGLNYRTTDVQSAIGFEQLKKLPKYLKKRNALVNIYKKQLGNKVVYQEIPDYVTMHPHMLFGVLVDPSKRDEIIKKLNENGVGTRICWPATHLQSYHSKLFKGSWPVTEKLSSSIINVPMGNALTMEDVEYVCEVFNKVIQ